jgi:hypothetical protein
MKYKYNVYASEQLFHCLYSELCSSHKTREEAVASAKQLRKQPGVSRVSVKKERVRPVLNFLVTTGALFALAGVALMGIFVTILVLTSFGVIAI